MTIHSFDPVAARNDDLFPQTGTFGQFNDTMRLVMAYLAQFQADAGGGAETGGAAAVVRALNGTPYAVTVSEDGTATLAETIPTPTPQGFLLLFRCYLSNTGAVTGVFGNANPLWLSINGAAHPLQGPRGQSTFGNFELRQDALYLAVFTGDRWQLLSTASVAEPADKLIHREIATGGALTLRGEHINSSVIIQAVAATLTLTIPAALLDRWPVHSWVEVFQLRHSAVTLRFDDPTATPVLLKPYSSGGAVPAGVVLNNVVHFRLMRTSPLAITFLDYPRGVR